jgi:hypothetical protein
MSEKPETLTIHRKALDINLDPTIFGSFAEIGGGQEVARTFFQAGGASGTIAKTISAYDKRYSDAIYSRHQHAKRYVSRERLEVMLEAEYDEVLSFLNETKTTGTRFFSFADTVSTLNFKKDNISHGWLGVRFQLKENAEPNCVIIHLRLHENDNLLQQNTLGMLGVNLIYACYYLWERPNSFLQSLLDNLSTDRVEITMVNMSGAELSYIDNRLLAVQLVKNEMTSAIMFDRHGQVQEPDDMLYKKNAIVFRGSFRPVTYVSVDMLKSSFSLFKKDEDYDKNNTIPICEITLNNLLSEGDFDEHDFLDRVDLLNEMGQNVMVSNFKEFYRLVPFLTQFRVIKLRIVIGIETFEKVLNEKYYTNLKGGLLEALGVLFPGNMKMYVYPSLDEKTDNLFTLSDLTFPESTQHLFRHLVENRLILDIKNMNKNYLRIHSKEILNQIHHNGTGWESMVPVFIARRIKERKLFGYRGNNE